MSEVRDRVFLNCSREDGRWRDQLLEMLWPLQRDRKVEVWSDQRIQAGARRREEIERSLRRARVAVLLVSPAFLASDCIAMDELPPLLERVAKEGMLILWIPVTDSLWGNSAIAAYQPAHDPARPLDRLGRLERRRVLEGIAERIVKVVQPEAPVERTADPEARAVEEAPQRAFMVPSDRNPLFTGRETLLAAIGEALQESRAAAITGVGGVGKSQTALEYAYRHRDEYRFVFWAEAESEATLDRDFGEIARRLDLAGEETPAAEAVREGVRQWLAGRDDCLLILDSVDDPTRAAPYLPPAPGGHVLLTSRAQDLSVLRVEQPVRLAGLPEDEAVAFLQSRTGRGVHPAEWAAVAELARRSGCLPLALELAGAYIAAREIGFDEYLALSWRRRLGMPARGRPEWGATERTVQAAWELSFEAVREKSPAAAELLTVSAFFAPEQIPYELVIRGGPELGRPLAATLAGADEDESQPGELLAVLDEYSLIQRDPATRSYSVHRLAQEMARAPKTRRGREPGLMRAERRTWIQRAVRALDRAFPLARRETWPLCERLLPHARAGAGWMETEGLASQGAVFLLNRMSDYLGARGQSAAAEAFLEQAIANSEVALGPEHPYTAGSLTSLAHLYRERGSLTAAEPLYQRALAICVAALGPEHYLTADSLSDLGMVYHAQGRLAEVEPLLQGALAIRERVLGPASPNTAHSLNNLAALFQIQGRLAEAEPLFQRALGIRERVLGAEHDLTARSLSDLALLYRAQGKHAEAEPLLQRALGIFEQTLGPEHPDSVRCREGLALLREEMAGE